MAGAVSAVVTSTSSARCRHASPDINKILLKEKGKRALGAVYLGKCEENKAKGEDVREFRFLVKIVMRIRTPAFGEVTK
jgi:virulence-associated protein VapD